MNGVIFSCSLKNANEFINAKYTNKYDFILNSLKIAEYILTEKKTETICILLGIKEPLEEFFSQKSELADLVTFYDFPTITDQNLVKILEKKLQDGGFVFSEEVKNLFPLCVQEAKHRSSVHYKNGWLVEKDILYKILENQASRLSKKAFILIAIRFCKK